MCFFLISRPLGAGFRKRSRPAKLQKKRNVLKIIVKKNFICKKCKIGIPCPPHNDLGHPGR